MSMKTTYVDINQNEKQYEQEYHGDHEYHELNDTNANQKPPQDDNYYATKGHDMDPIKESP